MTKQVTVAGIDIGNSTTEVCLATFGPQKALTFEASNWVKTTGVKGTKQNIKGIEYLLQNISDCNKKAIDKILLNEAAPVIGDTAMQAVTSTVITESAMIGHNPDTPAGLGVALGETIPIESLQAGIPNKAYIVIVNQAVPYEVVARLINTTPYDIKGLILEKDEAVLVYNRLNQKIPIVDEVKYIDKIPLNKLCAIEVAEIGKSINVLCNPYGIANLFTLSSDATKRIIPIAKSLVGKRSAVVIKSNQGGVKERRIPAGHMHIFFKDGTQLDVAIDEGSQAIMKHSHIKSEIKDVVGERDTCIGNMFDAIKQNLQQVSEVSDVQIADILAVDTLVPMSVEGALAGEVSLEKAVAVAAMVKSKKLPMQKLANALEQRVGIPVEVAGVEAVMATLGALTTQGAQQPLVILDIGGGSTDAAMLQKDGVVNTIHLAGAGHFVTMLIDVELGLHNLAIAEEIKRYPLAKVESLFHIRMENGDVKFYEEPLSPKVFGKVVLLKEDGLLPIETQHSLEKIQYVRQEAKKKVFVTNALRALKQIAPSESLTALQHVVLVGGSALDFEIPAMLLEVLAPYGIVVGKAEIRGKEGPRNAVATGLVLSKVGRYD